MDVRDFVNIRSSEMPVKLKGTQASSLDLESSGRGRWGWKSLVLTGSQAILVLSRAYTARYKSVGCAWAGTTSCLPWCVVLSTGPGTQTVLSECSLSRL